MPRSSSRNRIGSVAKKECLHIIRDPMTLFLTVGIPVFEMFMLGYAVNTNIRDVRTVVYDQARNQESRSLLREFTNSGGFLIIYDVFTDEDLTSGIVARGAL